jgi:DNA-binding CsgD family transcriptional regulator
VRSTGLGDALRLPAVSVGKVTADRPVPDAFAPFLPPAIARINVPAYVIDADGRICWLNPAAEALTGDVEGSDFTTVVDLDPERARRIFAENLAGGGRDRTISVLAPDGRRTTVDISSVPLTENHHAIGMFGLAVPEHRERAGPPDDTPLTRRQHEVLVLLADGGSTDEIASRLHLSKQTVRNHIRQILQRLNAKSRLAAVAAARREHLL